MTQLSISLFGSFQVVASVQPVSNFQSNKVRALLAYLIVEAGRPHSRTYLAGLLWPDCDDATARTYLRHALSNLQKVLNNQMSDPPMLLVTRTTLQWNCAADCLVDVIKMTNALQAIAEPKPDIHLLEQAVALYRGPLLEGFYLDGCPEFEEWLTLVRERLQRQAVDALDHIVQLHTTSRDLSSALHYAKRRVELEPWLEEGHRELMHLYASLGQRSTALAQYAHCRQLLAEELGVESTVETVSLYREIRSGTYPRPLNNSTKEERFVDEAAEFPELSSQPVHNLPAPLTTFLGRTDECIAITQRFQQEGVRLLTLSGPGGVGKTRLAIQVGWELLTYFLDGIHWVELAAIQSEELIVAAIARALGVRDGGERMLLAQVQSALAAKRSLLILDNFEHLIEAAPLVTQLLSTSPRLAVLVTSRERLQLQGEHEFIVEPLLLPTKIQREQWNAVADFSAVALFCAHAMATNQYFTLTKDNAAAVATICTLLDGLPLAIELAAARIKYEDPATILSRISTHEWKTPQLLRSKLRDAPARHRSVWDTIAWSYSLLSSEEQLAFRRLAVFVGGFTAEAAASLCETDVIAIETVLVSLADKSLLRIESQGDSAARYTMLEMIRQFGLATLASNYELEQAHRDHAHYYADLLSRWQTNNRSQNDALVLAMMRHDYANLRKTFFWFHEQGDVNYCVQLSEQLFHHWHVTHDRDGIAIFRKIYELLEHQPPSPATVEVLIGLGYFIHVFEGRLAARPYFEKALQLYEVTGRRALPKRVATAHGLLGWTIFYYDGDYAAAVAQLQHGHEFIQKANHEWSIAMKFVNRGRMETKLGRFDDAGTLLVEGLDRHRHIGDPWAIAYALVSYGIWHILHQEYHEAVSLLIEAQTLAQNVNAHSLLIDCAYYLAKVALLRKDLPDAQRFLIDVARLYEFNLTDQFVLEKIDIFVLLALTQNQPKKAAVLAHAIIANKRARGLITPPVEQEEFGRIVARVQAQLHEDEAVEAASRGTAMTLDDATTYACAMLIY